MIVQPIDTEALRREALGQLGQVAADPRWPGRVLTLLDALAASEHRADVAEARIKAWAQQYDYDMCLESDRADAAEARIKAVRDALDGHGKPTDRIGGLPDAIRRALDGDA